LQPAVLLGEFHFAFNLDGNIERQFRHADGAAAVRSDIRSEHSQNEI